MRLFFISLVIVAALWRPSEVRAQEHCLSSCPQGAPATNQLIMRTIYALSNNRNTKLADWVAYKVVSANAEGPSRSRNWAKDPNINSSDTLTPREYDHANVTLGIQRGHQAPLAAFKGHADWRMTNFLSNITPQFAKLNEGPWKDLETAIRNLAQSSGQDVFVLTGPLFEWPMAKLPGTDKDHRVPSAYWKIVALQNDTTIKVASFYFYQDTPKRAHYCDHMRTVDFIEAKSGLNFFVGVGDESALEAAQSSLVSELGC